MVQSERCPVSPRCTSNNHNKNDRRKTKLKEEKTPAIEEVRKLGCFDNWRWSKTDKSPEVRFYGDDQRVANFHPHWSSGTAGVRGDVPLDGRRYYWELHVSQRVFGTSIMFGVANQKARVHSDTFTNMLGEDCNGWGLSHKGLLWHNGQWSRYTSPFQENRATVIGLLYDGVAGTLTYFKDGQNLGVAFRNMNDGHSKLYPVVCSTAAKTKMTLVLARRDLVNLQDRCRDVIAQSIVYRSCLNQLPLPPSLADYVAQSMPQTPRVFLPAWQNNMVDM